MLNLKNCLEWWYFSGFHQPDAGTRICQAPASLDLADKRISMAGTETFDIRTLKRIICCDCGLVHRVSVDSKVLTLDTASVSITFTRDDEATNAERHKRPNSASERLDESISYELSHDTAYARAATGQTKNPELDYAQTPGRNVTAGIQRMR